MHQSGGSRGEFLDRKLTSPIRLMNGSAPQFITFSGMALITPLQGTLNLYSSILHPSTAPEAACPHRLFAPLTSPLPVIRPSPDAPNSKTPSHLVEVLDLPSEMQLKGRTVFLLQEMDCGLERLGQAVMTLGKVWPDVGSRGVLGIRGAFPVCVGIESVKRTRQLI